MQTGLFNGISRVAGKAWRNANNKTTFGGRLPGSTEGNIIGAMSTASSYNDEDFKENPILELAKVSLIGALTTRGFDFTTSFLDASVRRMKAHTKIMGKLK